MTPDALPVILAATAVVFLVLRRAGSRLLPVASPLQTRPVILLLAAAVVSFIPFGPMPGWQWLAGVLQQVAVPTMLLLADAVWGEFRPDRRWLAGPDRRWLRILTLVAAAVLYPLSLGLSRLDPYEWGWRSPAFDATVALGAAGLILAGRRLGVVLALALLACRFHLLESTNLWDYLIDPLLVAVAAFWAVREAFNGVWKFATCHLRPSRGGAFKDLAGADASLHAAPPPAVR